jgi:Skp family chaperone for outer membrane proteins
MKRLALLLVLFACLATTSAARSQQPTSKSSAPGRENVQRDTLDIKASPELQQALDDLAAAVQALARRITSDPELKAAAIQVASGLVTTAHQVVSEQSGVIQEALKTAADRISAQSTQQQGAKKR